MRTPLAAVFLAAWSCGALADDKAPKNDLERVQGRWSAKIGPNETPITVEIKDRDVVATFTNDEGRKLMIKGEIRLDDSKSPKQVDWVKFTRPDGGDIEDNRGIYELNGDEWKVCNGGPGNERPSDFKPGDGGPPTLIVLKRIKDDAPKDDKSDLARLQGKWKAEAGTNKDWKVAMEINDTRVSTTVTSPDNQNYTLKGELKLDDAKSPKTLDWIKFARPDGSGDFEPNLAIYKLDGDTLTICSGGPGKDRPTEFKAVDGGARLLEYKRVKGD